MFFLYTSPNHHRLNIQSIQTHFQNLGSLVGYPSIFVVHSVAFWHFHPTSLARPTSASIHLVQLSEAVHLVLMLLSSPTVVSASAAAAVDRPTDRPTDRPSYRPTHRRRLINWNASDISWFSLTFGRRSVAEAMTDECFLRSNYQSTARSSCFIRMLYLPRTCSEFTQRCACFRRGTEARLCNCVQELMLGVISICDLRYRYSLPTVQLWMNVKVVFCWQIWYLS